MAKSSKKRFPVKRTRKKAAGKRPPRASGPHELVLAVEEIPIDKLHPDPANPRVHGERNMEAIKSSLTQFGQRQPVVVQRKGMIIRAGNARWESAKALGWKKIAALVVDDEDAQAIAYAIADNRTAELALWNDETLARLMADFEVPPIGFTDKQMQAMLKSFDLLPQQETEVPDLPTEIRVEQCDCVEMPLEDDAVDLVFCSPPYETSVRTFEMEETLEGQDWVDWSVERFEECIRVCSGLVAWVIEGVTKDYRWSATPALLMADLHRRGANLRFPVIHHRQGRPLSYSPDWLRKDTAWIVCATPGKIPWSEPTALGEPPKHIRGGQSTRTAQGRQTSQPFESSGLVNPGNIITAHGTGNELASENEAPFSEKLAEFFVRSFCPPGGIVLDPFSGSGTTAAMAIKHGRNAIAFDIRESQVKLTKRRIAKVMEQMNAKK